jgi:acyl carrier protein
MRIQGEGEELERDLIELFGHVLQLSGVRPDDDFFTLGGDSLGAVEVMLALERTLGMSLPLPLLFDAPTPRELARELRAALAADGCLP